MSSGVSCGNETVIVSLKCRGESTPKHGFDLLARLPGRRVRYCRQRYPGCGWPISGAASASRGSCRRTTSERSKTPCRVMAPMARKASRSSSRHADSCTCLRGRSRRMVSRFATNCQNHGVANPTASLPRDARFHIQGIAKQERNRP
jgi:hypothetical protein